MSDIMRATYGDGRTLPPPMERHEYPEHPTYDESEIVAILNPEEAQQRRRLQEDILAAYGPVEEQLARLDDGARLDTPERHRARTVERIEEALMAATNQAILARRWSQENGYHPEVTAKIAEAVRILDSANALIDTFEAR